MPENKANRSLRANRPPVLGNTCILPTIGAPIHTIPTGISVGAEVTIDSETLTINAKDLKKQASLGKGHYGHVEKMKHIPTDRIFAVKHIRLDQRCTTKEQIKDLTVGMNSRHPYVITYFCGLWYEEKLMIVMELMETSLDNLLAKVVAANRLFPDNVLAYITYCVVTGLEYLHKTLEVIHRDVKPSNILANKQGIVKVGDFGISGDLTNSLASTNIGSQKYIAPERIDTEGKKGYRIQSDVWSLGVSVFELATGKQCYPEFESPFQQLHMVVKMDPPRLPTDGKHSDELCEFVAMCLVKEEPKRANYIQLLDSPFLKSVDPVTDQSEMKTFLADYLDTES